ncbi:MAG TPA: cell division protein FtsL [Candidatus Binatia bacterium]|nr:cell division protein FtsL [Candidatus Binatia bacterium]
MASALRAQARPATELGRERRSKKARTAGRSTIVLTAVLGIVLIGLVWLHVWLRLQVVHVGYVLSTTSKLRSRLEQENRELKIELATLTSPDRLESMARRRLGLRQPEKGQVIVLP